jgi:hypothetical protein
LYQSAKPPNKPPPHPMAQNSLDPSFLCMSEGVCAHMCMHARCSRDHVQVHNACVCRHAFVHTRVCVHMHAGVSTCTQVVSETWCWQSTHPGQGGSQSFPHCTCDPAASPGTVTAIWRLYWKASLGPSLAGQDAVPSTVFFFLKSVRKTSHPTKPGPPPPHLPWRN